MRFENRAVAFRALMGVLVVWSLAGCGESGSGGAPGSECRYTYECAVGMVCHAGSCVVPSSSDVSEDTVPVPDGSVDPDTSTPDTSDVSTDVSGDTGADAGTRVTFAPARYRRCTDDLECAVFGGNCLVEIPLSRPDASGMDRVRLSDLDPSLAPGQGICTFTCTNDPRVCDTVVVDGPGGASVPFSCQVIFAGQSPYPELAPAFPFADTLDPIALERGVPFASICRPPFQHSAAHSEAFCQPCATADQCGAGDVCYLERAFASPPSGSCVQPCAGDTDCPFGFDCAAVAGEEGSYCLPIAGTCGRCMDADGDQRGVGRCGPINEPNTGVDCDDTDPLAYYDAARPNHPFPQLCGDFDMNCNGLSDRVEQLGSEQHCAGCGDACVSRAGDIPNARRSCEQRDGQWACVAVCDAGFADCDGDVNNGCEAALGANQLWARDHDGDGRGSRTEVRYFCDGDAPAGWVQNQFDCDDTNPAVYGGGVDGSGATLAAAPELCDGIDNDCNGIVDDPGRVQGVGQACTTEFPGVCAAGRFQCPAPVNGVTALACVPNLNPATQANAPELCDGLDNNCNGQVDEGVDYYADRGEVNPGGPGAPVSCGIEGGLGICAVGTQTCVSPSAGSASWQCVGRAPEATDPIDPDFIDSNCDGSDGDLSRAVFVRPVAGGGSLDGNDGNNGSAQRPVATLNRAMTLACAAGPPCRDIYVQTGEYVSSSAITVPTWAAAATPPVRIYGGFNVSVVGCETGTCALRWVRGTGRSTFVREAPSANTASTWPYGEAYAALQASGTSGVLSVLLNQVNLTVRSPSASVILERGQHAPAQIGVMCPARGCGLLSFRDVVIDVENALNGGAGAAPAVAPLVDHNGRNGCTANTNCANYAFIGGEWMQYASADVANSAANTFGGVAAACHDGSSRRGGNSGAFRWQPPGGGNRGYRFAGYSGQGWYPGGGGNRWYSRDTNANPNPSIYSPTRGGDGLGGSGASWSGTGALLTTSSGNLVRPRYSRTHWSAGSGSSGSGGGGGGGCIDHPNYFNCATQSVRGGGGGAGGCGGLAGGTGGDGGHTVGILMVSPAAGEATLELPGGQFSIRVGRAGNGGNGANGGAGMPGGYGGTVTSDGVQRAEYQGGNGGDGAGGGGGAGGQGGSSVGVLRSCPRSGGTAANGCWMNLPALMIAAPGNYIQVGQAGGAGNGGNGGAVGAKTNPQRSDTRRVHPSGGGNGGNGGSGFAGTTATLQFVP